MPNNHAPGYLGAALAGVDMLLRLDHPAVVQIIDDYTAYFLDGPPTGKNVLVDPSYPVTWGYSWTPTQGVIYLSGVRTIPAGQALARSWLDTAIDPLLYENTRYIGDVASRMLFLIRAVRPVPSAGWTIWGHSMGGALAYAIAYGLRDQSNPPAVSSGTFGAPMCCSPRYPALNNNDHVRYTSDLDQVPGLPPWSGRAQLIYAGLSRAERTVAESWRHPVPPTLVNTDGSVQDGAQISYVNVGLTTLLATLQGRDTGLLGTGHQLQYYRDILALAVRRYAPAAVTVPTVTSTAVPTVPALPPTLFPATQPVPQTNQQLAIVVTAAAAAASERDQVPDDLGSQFLMKAQKSGARWSVYWLGREIAWGPTRKKAQALARHFNRFLRIYQGVGISCSQMFVSTLSDYLTLAADPNGPLKPTLYDGGSTPNQDGVDLGLFGIDLLNIVP